VKEIINNNMTKLARLLLEGDEFIQQRMLDLPSHRMYKPHLLPVEIQQHLGVRQPRRAPAPPAPPRPAPAPQAQPALAAAVRAQNAPVAGNNQLGDPGPIGTKTARFMAMYRHCNGRPGLTANEFKRQAGAICELTPAGVRTYFNNAERAHGQWRGRR